MSSTNDLPKEQNIELSNEEDDANIELPNEEDNDEEYSYSDVRPAAASGDLKIIKWAIWSDQPISVESLFDIALENKQEEVCLYLTSWLRYPTSCLYSVLDNKMYNLAKDLIENNEVKTHKLSEDSVRQLIAAGLDRSHFTHDVSFLDK